MTTTSDQSSSIPSEFDEVLAQLDKSILENKDKNRHAASVAWIGNGLVQVYIRHSKRYVEKNYFKALDIATVEVADGCRSQGFFTKFLEHAIKNNPYEILYIENVLEERFQKFFEKRGFTPSEISPGSYYLKK